MLLLLLLLSCFSRVQLCAPTDAAHKAPPSLRFSRQDHWSGLPFPSPMHESEKWKWSCSVVSVSSWPHGLQPTRLAHPWDFPGKSTGVGCHYHPKAVSSWEELTCWHYWVLLNFHEHGIFLCSFISLNSFMKVLLFSSYKSYAYFVRFKPKYFILGVQL